MRAIMRCLALGVLLSASEMLFAQVFSFQKVDVPGASATNPKGINARGDIVGLWVASGQADAARKRREEWAERNRAPDMPPADATPAD